MGSKYTTQATSGYNVTPPADDGTAVEANKVKWSTIKTKLSDVLKIFGEDINTALIAAFDTGPTAIVTTTTLAATHNNQFIEASGASTTLNLSDAATLGAGWFCWIRVVGTSNVTLGRITGADTLDGTAANITLTPDSTILVVVNAAANGFFTFSKSVLFAKGADVASANDLPLSATNDTIKGFRYFDVTGTTTINGMTEKPAGERVEIQFDGVLTLKHNTAASSGYDSFTLQGAADITTAAGDSAVFISEGVGSNWRVKYTRGDGRAVLNERRTTIFTASGTYIPTYTGNVFVTVVAGGGGGGGAVDASGGAGGGGGGGQTVRKIVAVTKSSGVTVTIGAGGAGGAGTGTGTDGGDSSFGSVTATKGKGGVGSASGSTGGNGGQKNTPTGGGAGGSTAGSFMNGGGGGGDISNTGGFGGIGGDNGSGLRSGGGGGGTLLFPNEGGVGGVIAGAGTAAAANTGAGGGGGGGGSGGNGGAGGAGADGICIVEELE